MAYAMFINLFLLRAEVFKEFYSHTEHLVYTQYLFFGLGEHTDPGAVRLGFDPHRPGRLLPLPDPG